MKNIILSTVFLLSCISLFAGHERGSLIITYEGVPGQPLKYEVTIRAIFDSQALAPPSNVSLNVASPCFSNFNQTLPRVGSTGSAVPILGADYCTSAPGYFYTGLAEYKGIVTLPQHCVTITLSLSSGAGRFDGTQNIQSFYDTPYFYAKLNSSYGVNNSPRVDVKDLAQAVCLNKNVSIYGFTEPDGDSLFFSKATPLKSATTNFTWQSGYNQANPLGTGSTYSLNAQTGKVQANVGSVGNYVIPIKYREYRFDPTTSSMILVGESIYCFIVAGSNSCTAPSAINIQHESIPNADSVDCGSDKIRFIASRQIARSSVTLSGSEFEVVSQSQGSLSVQSASLIQDSIIEVTLSQVPPLNDILRLTAKVGGDGNVIISRCGVELTANEDTLYYYTPSGVQPSVVINSNHQFLNTSYNSSASVADSAWWDFGDGNGSSQSTGNYNYSSPGSYTITYTAYGACGSVDDTTYTIDVCDSISASFSYTQSGDTIFFDADLSVNGASYQWDFGDGQNGNGQSVWHIYAPGSGYVAQLTVGNNCGDTLAISDTITTCEEPVPSWTYTVVSTTSAGMTVDFDGTASTQVNNFIWDFGDGSTDNSSLTPRHVYQTPGLHYYVSLTVENSCQQTRVRGFRMNEIGLGEYQLEAAYELYPNPTAGILNIELLEEGSYLKSIELYSNSGQLLIQKEYSDKTKSTQVSVNDLPSGQYMVILKSNNGGVVRKMIAKE